MGRTDGQTPDRYIDPAQHTMQALAVPVTETHTPQCRNSAALKQLKLMVKWQSHNVRTFLAEVSVETNSTNALESRQWSDLCR